MLFSLLLQEIVAGAAKPIMSNMNGESLPVDLISSFCVAPFWRLEWGIARLYMSISHVQ